VPKPANQWCDDVFQAMKARDIATICTIPDGGLTRLLERIEADRGMRLVTLTSEQEGIGVATGC
jgi:sulfopyruvate decarboxylase TPP-binding subunit